jgi:threonine/homoserine/homoserine lactone efflux protein
VTLGTAGDLLALFAGVWLVQAAPGPNSVAIAGVAMRGGRRPALLAAGGVAAGVFVWAVLFAFGLGAALGRHPALLTALEIAGGAYLLLLAGLTLRAPPRTAAGGGTEVGRRGGFLTGLGTVMTNPKAAMMWVGVALYLASMGLSGWGFLAVGAGVALSALAIYGAQAWLFSTGRAGRVFARRETLIRRAMAVVLALIGLRLLWAGLGAALGRAA